MCETKLLNFTLATILSWEISEKNQYLESYDKETEKYRQDVIISVRFDHKIC